MFRYEGLILSVGGNGRSYILILEAGPTADTTQSKLYFSRFSTKAGFCRVGPLFYLVNSVSFGAKKLCSHFFFYKPFDKSGLYVLDRLEYHFHPSAR